MLSRRTFIAAAAGAGCNASPLRTGQEDARRLYREAVVIDGLANASSFNIMWPPVGPLTPGQLANIQESGITAINLTVTVGRSDFETVVAGLAFWNGQVEANPRRLCVIKRQSDITEAKRARQLGLIF